MDVLRFLRHALFTSLIAIVAACAAPGAGTVVTPGIDPNVLTAAEIASAKFDDASAYEAIQRLRPQFFRTRGRLGTDGGDVLVSVDGGPLNTIESLRNVPATTVREVRYLSANDAVQRYGVRSNSGPVILVTQR